MFLNFPYKLKGKFALALSSGAAHGLAHIGVLEILEKYNIKIDILTGSSVGSIIGALWAEGYSSEDIYKIAKEFSWKKIAKLTLPHKGLLSIKGLEDMIKEYIPHNSFEGLSKKFGCVATSLQSEKPKYFTEGNLSKAICASCAIPVVFKPVKINNEFFIDGGFIENVPAPLARNMGADSVLGVRLNKYYKLSKKPDNMIKIVLHTMKIMSPAGRFSNYIDRGDVVITPVIEEIDYDGLSRIDKLLKIGKKAAKEKLKSYNGKYFIKKTR